LQGLEVTGVSRHGKFLDLDVSGLHLVVHLARAGWLRWSDALSPTPPRIGKGPLAARVHLDDGSGFDLTEAGTQKRLAMYVVHSPYDVPVWPVSGPTRSDPASASMTWPRSSTAPASSSRGCLRDQSVLAGVGNAYSDEVLHAAKLSPFRLGSSLSVTEVEGLYEALQSVLRDAVARAHGLAAGDLKKEKKTAMRVHGRTGLPCPVCGDTVREVSFADSSLQYCPTCQTGGKPLADRRLSRLLK
jgi:formamidopyrimidine-DNA glycosylase